jgi:hypothetical protein
MQLKNTDELLNEIKKSKEIKTFLSENDQYISNYTLPLYLDKLITDKNLTKKEVIKNSELNYTYAYQMINGSRKPSKEKLIQLCFGLNATSDEANRILLLADAGGLYSKNRRDCVLIFALDRGLSLAETNELLYELNEKIIDL